MDIPTNDQVDVAYSRAATLSATNIWRVSGGSAASGGEGGSAPCGVRGTAPEA